MTLDTEPMYCAEQINIPDNLGEILKAYAKEVIRQQPGNIYEFSARYFAQLDQQEDEYEDQGAEQVKKEEVARLVLECQDYGRDELELAKLRELCEAAGVNQGVVNQTLEVIFSQDEGKIKWRHFTIALCSAVAGIDDVTDFVRMVLDPSMFGNDEGFIHKQEFFQLFDWWSSVDTSITAELKSALFSFLDEGDDMMNYATFNNALKASVADAAPQE